MHFSGVCVVSAVFKKTYCTVPTILQSRVEQRNLIYDPFILNLMYTLCFGLKYNIFVLGFFKQSQAQKWVLEENKLQKLATQKLAHKDRKNIAWPFQNLKQRSTQRKFRSVGFDRRTGRFRRIYEFLALYLRNPISVERVFLKWRPKWSSHGPWSNLPLNIFRNK